MKITRRTAAKAMLATATGGSLTSCGPGAAAGVDSLPQQRVRTQVCVIGGGSGGIGAALATARAGANVVLLERESILGGTSTNAWVHTWEPVSGANGIPRDLYQAMKAEPLAVTYSDYDSGSPRRGGRGLPFEPRALNYAAGQMLEATGRCQTLLGATFCRARVEGSRIRAVDTWFSGTRLLVEADVFIDCTADGDVCADVGCEYHMGEDPKSRYGEPTAPDKAGMHLNGLTLCYRITDTRVKQTPYLPKDVTQGICPRPVHIVVLPNGDHLLNAVGMLDGNAILWTDYARLMREAYRRVLDHFFWLQGLGPDDRSPWTRYVRGKGYGTWSIVGVAPRIGVRETRRILGDYVLTENDCRAGVASQKHGDIIAVSDHAVDLHGAKGRLYEVPNGPYGIPLRCLIPVGIDNLMIASRAASFSHIAASSCRLSRTIMTLGQAAGNAAALCVKHRVGPRGVDVGQLQNLLKSQNVTVSVR